MSTALHLQLRGRSVCVIDRGLPGHGTSFGNAGLVQSEAFFPHLFPRHLPTLLRYARNRSIDASYHARALPFLVRHFFNYWRHSRKDRALHIARVRAPLISHSVEDHLHLARTVGAQDLLRRTGWSQAFHEPRTRDRMMAEIDLVKAEFGVKADLLDRDQLTRHEPHLSDRFIGAVHWPEPLTIFDPLALTTAYADHFVTQGGALLNGDAAALERVSGGGWCVPVEDVAVRAREVVICLGPWSSKLTRRFGYAPPLFVKRGYHMHYSQNAAAILNRPIQDVDGGYIIAPAGSSTRLLTGAEFAQHEAPPTPIQLDRAEPVARAAFPSLGRRMNVKPWLGARPCFYDMMPVIGKAHEAGMWYSFGHAHLGLTMGPTSGRLLASMMTGEQLFTDPSPYRPDRF